LSEFQTIGIQFTDGVDGFPTIPTCGDHKTDYFGFLAGIWLDSPPGGVSSAGTSSAGTGRADVVARVGGLEVVRDDSTRYPKDGSQHVLDPHPAASS
jgi:hypothetical protein